MAEYSASIEIDAPPAEVFEYLITEAGLTAWMGQHARLEPRVGGRFEVDIAGYPVRGHYLEVERPHRVVVSWGFAGNDEVPPGASTVAFTLTPVGRGTQVALVHSGLPETQAEGHVDGWSHFLPRLRIASAGGDPGDDLWQPGQDRNHQEETA